MKAPSLCNNMEKNNRTKKIIKKVFSIIGGVLIGFILVFSTWTTIDKFTGYNFPFIKGFRNTVIISGSMADIHPDWAEFLEGHNDQIQINDIVTTILVPFEEVEVYDIVIVYNGKMLICHRVVDKGIDENGEKYLITRGDANYNIDGKIYFDKNFKGKVIKVTSGSGEFVRFMQSPYFYLSLSVAITIYAVSGIIIDYLDEWKEDKEGKRTKVPKE